MWFFHFLIFLWWSHCLLIFLIVVFYCRQKLGWETKAILWVLFCEGAIWLHRCSGDNTDVYTLPRTSAVHAQSCSNSTEISLQVQPQYLPRATETEHITKTGSHAILQGWNLLHYCKHLTFGHVFYPLFLVERSFWLIKTS